MRQPRARTLHATWLLILLFSFLWQATFSGEEPLRVEDVVRRFVQGESVQSLLEHIRETTVEFSLDDEMLQELEIAGIPVELINAMAARQRELTPEPSEEAVGEEDVNLTNLSFQLNPPSNADTPHVTGGELSLQTLIPRGVAEQLELHPDQTHFDDLATYVQCRTPDHVPDRWRSQSPLGRDFKGTRRHRMLLFNAGAVTTNRTLVLQLPLAMELRLDEAINHRLTVGVAARVGDNYLNLTAIDLDDLLIAQGEALETLLRIENVDDKALLSGLQVQRVRPSGEQD